MSKHHEDLSYDISLINVVFPTEVSGVTYRYVPVGVLSLAAVLQKEGFVPEILDAQHETRLQEYTLNSFVSFFKKAGSKIIGISVMARDLPIVVAAAEKLKRERPGTILIFGGPGPTGSARELLKKFPFIDYVVMGEGEFTLLELMKVLKKNEVASEKPGNAHELEGLAFRDGEQVVVNPLRERIKDLDDLPLPAYELIDKKKYNYIYIPGARGCRHFCTFCDQPALWQGREIKRTVEHLFREIDFIQKDLEAPWDIAFSDNEFCADPDRFEKFIETLNKKNYSFPFSMDRRIDATNEDFLKKALKAGCQLILYGVESGSDNVLKEIRKNFKAEAIKPGLKLSAKFIQNNIASFMFNYPFETLRDFLKTINIIYSMLFESTDNFITFQLHYLIPLPRTPIFAKYKNTLIRRNVSNMMTSRDNLATYDYFVDNRNKKVLVLPRELKKSWVEPELEKIIDENPDVFPSHYIYSSPRLELKQKVIESLATCINSNLVNIFFRRGEEMVWIGKDIVTVTGNLEDKDVPAAVYLISWQEISNPEPVINFLSGYPDKLFLFSIDTSEFPDDRSAGKDLIEFLKLARKTKIKFKLISYLPRKYFSFTDYIRIQEEFKMPKDRCEASDLLFVDESSFLRTPDGRVGKHIARYRSRKDMFREFY